MSIDADQSLDSLVGLHNKLLFIHAKDKSRVLLIPEADVSWAKSSDHIHVKVGWQSTTQTHAYTIDRELHRLLDNGSLESKLLLCYSHGLTYFCLPDPLTQKTGGLSKPFLFSDLRR